MTFCPLNSKRQLFIAAPGCRPPSPVPPPGGGNTTWRPSVTVRSVNGKTRGSCLFASKSAAAPTQENKSPSKDLLTKTEGPPHALLLPLHPYLQRTLLPSGLEVFMLPHAHPAGSLEVHLEIHAGSTAEEEGERGMAHLCEHLIFMGNRKRADVVALQGEANAFTDFHHTVYFVSWRVGEGPQDQSHEATGAADTSTTRKLDTALEMMREVFTAPTQFTAERLMKEKAAVTSESSLVNTIFYRKEQAQLSKLHSDTLLPSRFPIGDMNLVRQWSIEQVRSFFARFYRPENASLYIVGDVAPTAALRAAHQVLGALKGDAGAHEKWSFVSEKWRRSTVKKQSIFFPPLTHAWTRDDSDVGVSGKQSVPSDTPQATVDAACLKETLSGRLHLWQHSLLQHFSLLFLRKLPITPMRTVGDFFRILARKLVLQALSMRLVERCRSADGGWMRVEVADTESIKEGCRVVSVEAEAEQSRWRDAVRIAVEEVRQMAEHGLSKHELGSLLDSYRINLDRMHLQLLSSADILRLLMDGSACGHSIVHLEDERRLALQFSKGVLLPAECASLIKPSRKASEEGAQPRLKRLLDLVNKEARELFSWLDVRGVGDGVSAGPSAICAFLVQSGKAIASGFSPGDKRVSTTQLQGHLDFEQVGLFSRDTQAVNSATMRGKEETQPPREPFALSKESILEELCAALSRQLPARQHEVETPKRLLSQEKLAALEQQAESHATACRLKEAGAGVKALQLVNGIKVNIKPLEEERKIALIRVLIPGGRMASVEEASGTRADKQRDKLQKASAAMVVGARTMMEGGAVGSFSREQIEAFCQERLIGVSIECLDEFLVIDVSTPAFAARDSRNEGEGNESTLENAMQLLHLIFTAFHFESSAFRRAKQQTYMDYHAYSRDLVGYSLGELIVNMTGRDPRFDALKPAVVEGLDLPFVEQQIRSSLAQKLGGGSVEVSVVGDVKAEHVARLASKYLGTIKAEDASAAKPRTSTPFVQTTFGDAHLQSPYLYLQHRPAHSHSHSVLTRHTGEQQTGDAWTKVRGRRLHAYVRDSESRAVIHIGGFACNRWGRNPDGSLLWQQMNLLQQKDCKLTERLRSRFRSSKQNSTICNDADHRRHPAFPRVALRILQELVTKRLFSVLREEKRLTYEAAFEVLSFDILWGGAFIITVHTQPEETERALEATHFALQQLTSTRPLSESQLEGAKQQVISRHIHDRKYGRYWLDLLGGMQLSEIPEKNSSYFEDFERVVDSVTLQDVHLLLRLLGIDRNAMWEAVGISGPVPPPAVSRLSGDMSKHASGGPPSARLDGTQQSALFQRC
ncbi:hypothetical protein ACSSS7_002512 [Eimeria intestinalis]